MNLAIEYIKRNTSTQDFLAVPCSLFLESFCETKKIVLVFNDNLKKDSLIRISQYNISEWTQSGVPRACSFEIEQALVFNPEKIISSGFFPISYQEEPINVDYNCYNHPMEKIFYENYIFNFLNTSLHRSYKKDWLWDAFTSTYLTDRIVVNKMHLNTLERRCIVEEEKRHVRNNRPRHWKLWKYWLSQMFFKEEMATELIFSSIYDQHQIS